MYENLPPNPQTIAFIAAFLTIYLVYLVRTTIKGKIDLYDFMLLATVGILPAIFAFLPGFTGELSKKLGVRYPFIILFGSLFFVVFFYLNRLVVKINKISHLERQLAQEMAFLKLNKEK